MNPHIIITDHAVDQYVARCAPDATDPRADLHMLAASARSLRRRTYRGQPLWATNRANVLLVTKHDRACGIVCVTVITPEMEDARRADVDEVVAAYQRMQAAREAAEVMATLVVKPQPITKRTAAKTARQIAHEKRQQEAHEAAVKRRAEAWARHQIMLAEHAQRRAAKGPSADISPAERKRRHDALMAEHAARRAAGVRTKSVKRAEARNNCPECRAPIDPPSPWVRLEDGKHLCVACGDRMDLIAAELDALALLTPAHRITTTHCEDRAA